MVFWLDCLVSSVSTIWFAVTWFVYTDHSLPELADDPEKLAAHDRAFKMESQVSIAVLIVLRAVHASITLSMSLLLVTNQLYSSISHIWLHAIIKLSIE